ncbi:MAG: HAD-IIA family hydrolase [Microscillaceae bacterium]|nr:HAD-IIA family hydrolase [Microscillaceae bacterium]
MFTHNFKEVVSRYKAVFLDSFGVLRNHQGIIPGIDQTLKFLIDQKIEYFLLTNDASRSPEQLAQHYKNRGIHDISAEQIISSGMLAREYLQYQIKTGTVAYLGTEDSAHYIETNGLRTLSIHDLHLHQIDDVVALVFLDDEGFDWNHDINKAINLLRIKNMPVIVANTDVAYPVSRHEIAVATGAIADMVEAIVGKRFIRFGKPDAQMFMFAYEMLQAKGHFKKNDLLMVGDTLDTDIIGGNKFGIDTVLVLSGNTLAHKAELHIESSGIIPTYICEAAVLK